MNCGGSYDPFQGGKGCDLGMISAISKAFEKQHKRCKEAKDGPRCGACLHLGHSIEEHVTLRVHDPRDWPGCGDAGLSSKAIWAHMLGLPSTGDYPYDPDDFGRCSRLVAAPWASGWRARMPEMAKYGKVWAALAAMWPTLEALFAEERPTGRAPKLYAAMQECRKAGAS
jgi:hypothetical protein